MTAAHTQNGAPFDSNVGFFLSRTRVPRAARPVADGLPVPVPVPVPDALDADGLPGRAEPLDRCRDGAEDSGARPSFPVVRA